MIISFISIAGLTNGLSYTIYDIPCGMTPIAFSDVFSIEKDLYPLKSGVLLSNNISSALLNSELYVPPPALSTCHLLTFTSYLHIEEVGSYALRMMNDATNMKVVHTLLLLI